MNNDKLNLDHEFEINRVYSNQLLRIKEAMLSLNFVQFIVNLYINDESKCNIPKTLEASKQLILDNQEVWNYIIPVKRTKCYLHVKHPQHFVTKHRIRKDVNDCEYIKIDDIIIIRAGDVARLSADEAHSQYLSKQEKFANKDTFLHKLDHLEIYGYVYVSNSKRVTTIEELENEYSTACEV